MRLAQAVSKHPSAWSRGLCVALCWLLAASATLLVGERAHAQAGRSVVVLEVAGEARHARSSGAAARTRAIATLTARGFTVSRGPAGCADPECAAPLLSGDGLALAIALWGRTRCERVAVALLDAHGASHGGEVLVEANRLDAAIDGAITRALTRLEQGSESSLGVVGEPAGATITLDQTPWGTLPHSGQVTRGEHQLAISAEGYVTERRMVQVGDAAVEVSVALRRSQVPDGRGASDAMGADRAPHAPEPLSPALPSGAGERGDDGLSLALTVSGAALLGAGVLAATVGIVGLALPDSGSPTAPDFLYERAAVDASIGWLIAGAVSAAAGTVLLVLGVTSGPSAAPAQARRPALLTF